MRARIELFVLLLAFWLVLSDHLEPLFIGMGVASAAGVAWLLGDFFHDLFPARRPPLRRTPQRLWRFTTYVVWLLGRVLVSSVEVARVALHPRMPMDPGFVRFATALSSPMARATLANSITLVPGTMTVRMDGDELLVHALWPGAAEDLRTAAMQRRIAHVFLEPADEAPIDIHWEPAGRTT